MLLLNRCNSCPEGSQQVMHNRHAVEVFSSEPHLRLVCRQKVVHLAMKWYLYHHSCPLVYPQKILTWIGTCPFPFLFLPFPCHGAKALSSKISLGGPFGQFRHFQRKSVYLTFFGPLRGRKMRFRKFEETRPRSFFLIYQNLHSIFQQRSMVT